MKKYLLALLCVFLGYSTVYASFPVTQNSITDFVEIVDSPKTIPLLDETPLANWSLALGLLWFPFLILAFIFSWEGTEENAVFFFGAGIASFIGAIITGIMSLSRNEGGKWKAIVGLSLTLGILLLTILDGNADDFFF